MGDEQMEEEKELGSFHPLAICPVLHFTSHLPFYQIPHSVTAPQKELSPHLNTKWLTFILKL